MLPLSGARAAAGRRQPLLGCSDLADAAWLLTLHPCGASGAARDRCFFLRLPVARFFGLARSTVVPLQLKAGGFQRQFCHLRCWGEGRAAHRVPGWRCRPVERVLV